MIIIILAAGKGSRLYPYTKNKPKCLVKYKNKSILNYQLDVIKKFKISQIYLVSGYKSERIKTKDIIKMKNKEYERSNMVYSLFLLKKLFNGKEDIIISYGDIIYKERILKKLLNCKNKACTVIDKKWEIYWRKRFSNPLLDAESLKLDKNNFILDIGKKVESIDEINGQYIGLTKFSKKITKQILYIWESLKKKNNNVKNMYFTDFLRVLIKKKISIKSVSVNRGWLEFDNSRDLKINF